MSLLERSRSLAERTSVLKDSEGLVEKTKAFSSRANQFVLIIAQLRASAGGVKLLQAHGVAVKAATSPAAGIRQNVADWRVALAIDDAAISAPGQAVQPKLIDPTNRLSRSLEEAALAGWIAHVKARLPIVSEDLLAVSSTLPEQTAKVVAYRSTFERAEAAGRKLPASSADIDRFQTYANQCQQAVTELENQSISPAVVAFFKATSTPAGATLGLLTPEVLEFLRASGLVARYRIRNG
jgi:hypothetical protein